MRIARLLLFVLTLTTLGVFAQQPAASPQSKASVYVYRYKQFVGSALSPSVYCDEVQLARMENGRYFSVTLDPGQHTFRSNDAQSGVQLDLKPGQEYFVRVEIAAGMMKGHGRLILTAAEQGRYELQSNKLKPLDANKVEDKSRVSVAEVKFDKPAPVETPASAPTLKPAVARQPSTDAAPDHVNQVVLSDPAPEPSAQESLGDAARKARQKKPTDTTTTQPN
jgi:hypothetical protein